MRIDIITCLPALLAGPFAHGIIGRAIEKKIITLQVHNLRAYGIGKREQLDDHAYGGGAGMVLMVEPIVKCIEALQQQVVYDEVIYMAPDGERLTQQVANKLSLQNNLIILCGHYKGVDERVRTHFITREISIGDYVLSGGELAAGVLVDSIVRLLPGAISDATSALTDSFQDGLVAPPVYSRPANFRDLKVPDVLLSGHAAKIDAWRAEQALLRTKSRRGELADLT